MEGEPARGGGLEGRDANPARAGATRAAWAELPIAVEEHGKGPPLLFLHGYGGNRFTWRHWVPALREDHHLVLVDLMGFGEAPAPPADGYAPSDLAEVVHTFIERRDLHEIVLVGHSLGGGVALLTALRLIDRGGLSRLRGLVIVAGASFPQRLPPFARAARIPLLGRLVFRLVPMRPLVRWVLRTVTHPSFEVRPEVVEGYARPLATPSGRRALVRCAREIVPTDVHALTRRYPEIDLPALLVWGEEDRVVPVDLGRRLEETLPAATLRRITECGHLPPEEAPEETLSLVRDFLGSLGAPSR